MSQQVFDISVRGEMSGELRDAFDDVHVSVERGHTRLRVVSLGSSTLYGILDRLESFGLELLEIHSVDVRP
jgi:hypothetical protein